MLLDFGAAWDEHEAEPLQVRVRPFDAAEDEEITLPGSMPAGLRLHLWNARQGGEDRGLTWDEMQAAGRFLFGGATFQRWLDERITEDRLGALILTIVGVYSMRERQGDDAPGEAGGASEAPPTFSATGTESKRTSPATTPTPEMSGG